MLYVHIVTRGGNGDKEGERTVNSWKLTEAELRAANSPVSTGGSVPSPGIKYVTTSTQGSFVHVKPYNWVNNYTVKSKHRSTYFKGIISAEILILRIHVSQYREFKIYI